VEKPLTKTSEECEELIALADGKGVRLFVGHVFLYNPAVIKLKELIDSGELGELCYVSSVRRSLGPVRTDVNSLWDLAPHCISIILHILGRTPVAVNCNGLAFLDKSVHDVTYTAMHFDDGPLAHTHCSWIDPKKIRQVTVVGSKKMAVYDDVEPLEKIKIYDRGVAAPRDYDTFGEFQLSYRYGDTYIPKIELVEPLKAECEHFIDCVRNGKKPKTDGRNGLGVVRVLEAADQSLHENGRRIMIRPSSFESSVGEPVAVSREKPQRN
jgi:predicted dehydrogenase